MFLCNCTRRVLHCAESREVPCIKRFWWPTWHLSRGQNLPSNSTVSARCAGHPFIMTSTITSWGLGWRSGSGAALLVGRSRNRFPVVSLDFSVTCSFRPHCGLEVDSEPSENEYQEHFLGVNAVGAWGWRPYNLHMPHGMEILEPKTPGTLWVTPGMLRDTFTFTFSITSYLKTGAVF
jgi:hypothetical protein